MTSATISSELPRDLQLLDTFQTTHIRRQNVGNRDGSILVLVVFEHRNQGNGALIVSSELDEVVALGDRIAVMYEGRISGVVDPSASRESIGLLMAGHTTEASSV